MTLGTEGRIIGSAQNTSRGGDALLTKASGFAHEYRSAYEAVKAAEANAGATVYMNRAYSTASNHATRSLVRPDVMVKSASGEISAIEVASKSQSAASLVAKNQSAMNSLPASMRGNIEIVDNINVLGTRFAAPPTTGANYILGGVAAGRTAEEAAGLGAFATAQPTAPYSGSAQTGFKPPK